MIKKISTLVISSVGLTALASGCAMEPMESEDMVGFEEQGAVVCSNDQATNALAASMAVVMAREVGRWDPRQDLTKEWKTVTEYGQTRNVEVVALTQAAKNRCSSRGYGQCTVLQGLLNLQFIGSGMQFGGAVLDSPNVLRDRMLSYYTNQRTCIDDTARNGDAQPNNCPRESNELIKFADTTSGSTCAGGKDYWYKANYGGTSNPLSGTDAAQLKNNLLWAGGNQNPYLAYSSTPGQVKVDPLDGSTGSSGSGSGGVEAALNPVLVNGVWRCDDTNDDKTPNPNYRACTCNSQARSWKPAPTTGFWRCKL